MKLNKEYRNYLKCLNLRIQNLEQHVYRGEMGLSGILKNHENKVKELQGSNEILKEKLDVVLQLIRRNI